MMDKGIWIDELRCELHEYKEPFCTICHLDPWFNNMLFQFKEIKSDNGKVELGPEDALLLDLQIMAYVQPGNDLAHFLMTSTTPELRKNHLDEVLHHYHDKLLKIVADLGEDLSFYTFDILKEDYKLATPIGI